MSQPTDPPPTATGDAWEDAWAAFDRRLVPGAPRRAPRPHRPRRATLALLFGAGAGLAASPLAARDAAAPGPARGAGRDAQFAALVGRLDAPPGGRLDRYLAGLAAP